jgi:hypothetical protein
MPSLTYPHIETTAGREELQRGVLRGLNEGFTSDIV